MQDRAYIGVRDFVHVNNKTPRFLLLDFNQAQTAEFQYDGIETGYFIQLYNNCLQRDSAHYQPGVSLVQWFNGLPIEPEGKIWVTEDGELHRGNVVPE